MKLSNETVNVLKNFSTINPGLKFKQGNKLTTMSESKTILAEAVVSDEFPQDFCVYDLTDFLSFHNMYSQGEIEVDSTNVTFKEGRKKSEFRLTAENQIVVPPQKTLNLPSVDVQFTLKEEELSWLMKSAAMAGSPHVAVACDDGETVYIKTFDADDNSTHVNSIEMDVEGSGSKYKLVFKTENLKLIPGEYEVEISSRGLSHFKNTKQQIQYWIAIEAKDSKFGE